MEISGNESIAIQEITNGGRQTTSFEFMGGTFKGGKGENLMVITDRNGKIIGSVLTRGETKDEPKMIGISPLEGQMIQNVDVQNRLAKLETLDKLVTSHFTEMTAKTANLKGDKKG